MKVIIGVPHCRFMLTRVTPEKANILELTEFFAVHRQTEDGFLGLAIKVVNSYDSRCDHHKTVEILERYEGLSYSAVAEKVKNMSKVAVRNLVDELSVSADAINPIEYAQSRFGREAANIFDDTEVHEVKAIFRDEFGPIRSELNELILGSDEYAAYKGVQGSW